MSSWPCSQLDAHRKRVLAVHQDLTLTGLEGTAVGCRIVPGGLWSLDAEHVTKAVANG
jgi:hypothetical protein